MSGTPLPSSFDGDTDFYEENRWQKFSRRLKEEPLIPLGCALTTVALYHASRSIKAGDHNRTNRMFRFRIYAQGFTIVAMLAGSMYWDVDRKKRKEFEKAVEERKVKEKNENWIKELEARDEEEKEFKRIRERRRELGPGRVEEKVKSAAKEVVGKSRGVVDKAVGKTPTSKQQEEKVEDAVVETWVDESPEPRKGVLESVQSLLWGKKK